MESAVQRFYRFQARIYDLTRWAVLHGRRRAVDRLGIRPDDHVLEVGCGTGLNFHHLRAPLDPVSGSLTGLDFSPEMLARARKRVSRRGWSNVELARGDAMAMDLERKYDRILFAYSLTMIPDWRTALLRAREHLADGGRLVVLDFGIFQSWGPMGALVRGWLRLNHVDVHRSWAEFLRSQFRRIEVESWLGGYNLIVTAET